MAGQAKNVAISRTGSKLTIEIDLDQRLGRSKKGNSDTIATSNGFQYIEEGSDIYYTLMVGKVLPKDQRGKPAEAGDDA